MSDQELYFNLHVFCCTNERPEGHKRGCCKSKEAGKLRNYMKARAKELGIEATRINTAGCLDRCEDGPVLVIYPQGTWYRYETIEDVEEILQKHLIGGELVERLKLPNQQEA